MEKNIKYFCLDVRPRYWEDSDINGESDIEWEKQKEGVSPKMPLSYRNEETRNNQKSSWYSWKIKIDIETGIVQDWPNDVEANILYKVCDEGTYWFETEDGEVIHKIDSYVPRFLDFHGDSWGDYIDMTIAKDGQIAEWHMVDRELLVENFLKIEGF